MLLFFTLFTFPPLGIISLALLLARPAAAQAADNLDCPDSTLTTYLVSLIDTLYANGLTVFEQLIAELSESDSGYALLEQWYTSELLTLLPPTDAAFQAAGVYPPFAGWTEWEITSLVVLHTLQGQWIYSSLPPAPLHAVASTIWSMSAESNSTTVTGAYQAAVLVQGGDGASIVVVQEGGNATSWDSSLDLSGTTDVDNVSVLPINSVLSFPPSPTDAFASEGLDAFSSSLSSITGDADSLDALTPGGLTIFAPLDPAWSAASAALATDPSALGNHYTTSYSLFSPAWVLSAGGFSGLTVASGAQLNVAYNASGHFVSLGSTTSRIVVQDVILANGVMHIIDAALVDANAALVEVDATSSTATGPSSTGTSSTGMGSLPSSSSLSGTSSPGTSLSVTTTLTTTSGTSSAMPSVPASETTAPSSGVGAVAMNVTATNGAVTEPSETGSSSSVGTAPVGVSVTDKGGVIASTLTASAAATVTATASSAERIRIRVSIVVRFLGVVGIVSGSWFVF